MEVVEDSPLKKTITDLVLKEKSYFLSRREVNWKSISKCALVALGLGIFGILLIPAPQEDSRGDFHEKIEIGSRESTGEPNPTQETLDLLSAGRFDHAVPKSLDHLYSNTARGNGSQLSNDDHNSSMILTRGGLDSKTQLPPGSRISVHLYERAIISAQGLPVIGVVIQDCLHEDVIAIPAGSKIFGEISYDDGGDRAHVSWRSIRLPDGRERQISAIGVGVDGQVGVVGKVHSEAFKNAMGQALTRFIGAYAEGSMQRGPLGGSPGGSDNGWKNAIAETAKDRADVWASELQKEKRWIEVSGSTEFYAVLTANFAFRDPGSPYER